MKHTITINNFFGFVLRAPSILILTLIILHPFYANAQEKISAPILLHAARVFDGIEFKTNTSVLVVNGKVAKIDTRESFQITDKMEIIDLGNATLLPGFIELHAHLSYQNVPPEIVLKHGITTIRDLGGPVHKPYGGDGSLRIVTSGPIITAPNGYPINKVGTKNIAIAVVTESEARKSVRDLVDKGAVVIKIALEPGGEAGAPWSVHHSHAHHDHSAPSHADTHHQTMHKNEDIHSQQAWPLLSEEIVKAIVDEAHKNNRKVSAHIAEAKGAQIALNAGVDEWAHVPCDSIPESLLKKAKAQNVKIVSTIDTLSKCIGVAQNAAIWTSLGGEFLYGAEIAHPDIPWGIDVQELFLMMQMGKMELMDVLRSATSKAGQHLGFPLLGTLQPGAPADIIGVKGDPIQSLKILEYPDLVMSGGGIIVNNF